MPGHYNTRAYFSEAERNGEQLVYSPVKGRWIGSICALAIVTFAALNVGRGIFDPMSDLIAGRANWDALSYLMVAWLVLVLVLCLLAARQFGRSAITSSRLRLDRSEHTLNYERFLFGRPCGQRVVPAAEISHLSLSKHRRDYQLRVHFKDGQWRRIDSGRDPAPLERLAADIADALGVPIEREPELNEPGMNANDS